MKRKIVWATFWTTGAILIPALLFIVSGCMKAPTTDIDKGVTTDCQQIDKAMSELQTSSVLSIKKSEFAYIESTTRLENLSPELTQQYGVTIMDRQENSETIQLTIREEVRERIDGQFKTSIKEGPAYIQKTGNHTQTSNVGTAGVGIEQVSRKLRIMASSAAAQGQGAYCQAKTSGVVKSYNNLEISNFDAPVPAAVRARSDCGGLANCEGPLKAKQLKFDRWIEDPNDSSKEIRVTTYIVTAPEVPFFATVFSQCVQYSWPVENRQVLVTACDDVKDFKFGVN